MYALLQGIADLRGLQHKCIPFILCHAKQQASWTWGLKLIKVAGDKEGSDTQPFQSTIDSFSTPEIK